MPHHIRLTLTALTATAIMAMALTNASANRLSISGHNVRVVWRSLEFAGQSGGFAATRCSITLEGSFHSNTIKKVEKALIGHISRASIGSPCTNGSASVHTETLPWKVDYNGFTGTLPAIRSVRFLLVGDSFRIAQTVLFTFTCDAAATEEGPGEGETLIDSSGNTLNLQPDPNTAFPTTGGSCPEAIGIFKAPTGDGQITVLGATTRIRLTLI
jgi:hypothetical protein